MDNAKVTVTPSFSQENAEDQYLTIETDILGAITREIANLKEDAVRKALMELGWTPPEQQPADVTALVETLEHYANEDNWEKQNGEHRSQVWVEPDTNTPEGYDGFELAKQALAAYKKGRRND